MDWKSTGNDIETIHQPNEHAGPTPSLRARLGIHEQIFNSHFMRTK
jgi:hypothetical protein